MESYQDMKRKHQKLFDEFEGVFYAFNGEQFEQGVKKVGATKGSIVSMGCGAYIINTRVSAFNDLVKDTEADLKKLKKDRKQLIDALSYELMNHEYCVTHDVSDALDALSLTRAEIPQDILDKACRNVLRQQLRCNKKDKKWI